ncbi:glycoside hydrolase family 3 C-terminal domain-containing protein [Solirubrobacter soli]|uniref:glycoside hydrolase family 3 C-terminal domain-containing protein n=1 Tax=Solirubrobacter soli TaxID=363832 RepID=UPI000A06082E|nr:glycoside hydrolase family 3 C-terminal domain-containing protein [Solirubrobacter soli]
MRASLALATSAMAVAVALPGGASAEVPPYSFPVTLPAAKQSPAVDANAPYTSVVLDLIHQLEPSNPPTRDQLANASKLLHDGPNGACHNVGPVSAPTGTNPSIAPICWTDAQGVLNTSGPNARGSTGPTTLMALGSTFDRGLGNAWGQTEGTESRSFMVTGLFGPQTDLDRLPNWGRNLTTTGEDPYLSHELVASQINGIQGVGTMSQMKHFAVYNGQNQNVNTDISDQPLHENYLLPYEGGFVDGKAAATMCSYQIFRDTSTHLPTSVSSLTQPSPFQSGLVPATWPLNESHFACEQPLIMQYVLRDLWHSQAFIGSDYPATHSTSGILQGEDQEMPTQTGFFSADTGNPATDPTGSTCLMGTGADQVKVDCSVPGATHAGGIPGPNCPANGCKLVDAVMNGTMPLAVFNQSLARILYQEQRFGLLGCDQTPVASTCTNPGGIGTDRTGTAPLPVGSTSGTPVLGTKNGDAAIVERMSEEGATLLKNTGSGLPLVASGLNDGDVLVTGANANHTVADPTNEASTGMIDRNAVNPLQQLKEYSGKPGAFTFAPANDPTGYPVPSSALSRSNSAVTGNLARTGPGAGNDSSLDFTSVSAAGQLAPGSYSWTGYIYVPTADTYTFAFQQSASVANANVTVNFDGTARTLANAANVYGATTPGTPTNAGYTEPLLTNRTFSAGALTAGFHPITITFNNDTSAAASFRFAYSRTQGDIDDAAAAARGKKAAIVFVNDGVGAVSTTPDPDHPGTTISAPTQLSAASNNLISAVAAANPNTIVVLDTANPVLMPWFDNVKSVLEMWFAGQEGGTATARVLLGLANPGGHSSLTWPKNATDTIWGYNEPAGALYPGSPGGRHPERLNGNGGCAVITGSGATCAAATGTVESEGIYAGYRYFDKLGITPQVPFGYGLSYTTFGYSNLSLAPKLNGTVDVSFDVTNTGSRAGDDAAQVYVGAGASHAGIQQAVRSLRGFERVSLDPGQTKHVTITLDQRSFQYWDETSQQWVDNYGSRQIWVGDSSATANLPLSASTTPIPAGSGASGTVGGDVPATLSLTLGTPAAFGPFTPGLAKDYTATQTANVISTAGNATLSVSDPSTTAPGHLVNGSYALPQALQASATSPAGNGGALAALSGSPLTLLTWPYPISNDPVSITFKQSIGSGDALRTGSYSKTLTYTLSTTQP